MLLNAAGSRLEHMIKAHAAGAVSGPELQRRIDEWQDLIKKIDACLED